MPTRATCEREIERLHEFFVEWYAGKLDQEEFDRMERALAPGFEMITPNGRRNGREAVLDAVRESAGRNAPGEFDIEIRTVEVVADLGDHAVVRYEEWQTTPEDETGRISTVLFTEDPDTGRVVWRDLQETWIEDSTAKSSARS